MYLHGKIKWTAILINDVNNKQLFKYLELLLLTSSTTASHLQKLKYGNTIV